jgi:hypothetical protein
MKIRATGVWLARSQNRNLRTETHDAIDRNSLPVGDSAVGLLSGWTEGQPSMLGKLNAVIC